MRGRWWETGGSPPLKPQHRGVNSASFWMDPDLGFKIKLVISIVFVIACFAFLGVSGGVIGLLAAVFLTKGTSQLQRW